VDGVGPGVSSAARRTERLLNLLIALLSTRVRLTKEQLRTAVPQYDECASDEAFDRMFERDKEELRELGVPLVAAPVSAWFDDDLGYTVDRESYALPEVSFTAGELAVLGLASRVWQQASLAGPAARALVKLRALGVEPDDASLVGVEPRVRTAEPAFDPLYAATRDRAEVAFRYRTARTGLAARRRVQPWQLRSWRGQWYLIGHDTGREDTRVFRLSRIEGAVTRTGEPGSSTPPDDLDAPALLARWVPQAPERTATVGLRPGAGVGLRVRAGAGSDAAVVEVAFTDVEELAEQVAAAGADAVVHAPDDLREAVVRRLRGALEAADAVSRARPAPAPARAGALAQAARAAAGDPGVPPPAPRRRPR
jgi:predicted DNA-binding transcriptional regulator YafY